MGRARLPEYPLLLPLGLVLAVVAFWSALLGDGLRTGDFPGHVLLTRVLSDIVSAGSIPPLWNAHGYLGTSLVAGYLHPIGSLALLSPFTLVYGAERGLEVGCLFYVSLGALSMYVWCLSWGRSRSGAALGALVYVLHPAVLRAVGTDGQMHQPVTLAVLPLVFLAWTRLGAKPGVGRVVFAALASSLLLFDVQRFFLAMPFVGIMYLATARRGGRFLAAGVCALLGLGLLLCFPLLPVLEERSLLQWHHPDMLAAWRARFSLSHALEFVDRDGLFTPLLAGPRGDDVATSGGWYQGVVAIVFVTLGSVWTARGGVDTGRRLRLAVTFSCIPVVIALAFGPNRLLTGQGERAAALLAAGPAGIAAFAALLAVGLAWITSLGWLRAELRARWPERRGWVDAALLALAVLLGMAAPFDLLSRAIFVYSHMRAPAHFALPMLGFLLGSAVCLVTPAWQRAAGTPLRTAVVLLGIAGLHTLDVLPYRSRLEPQLGPRAEARLRETFQGLATRPEGRVLDVSGYSPLTDMLAGSEARRGSARGWLAWMQLRHASELLVYGIDGSLGAGDPEQAAELAGLANIRFFSRIALSGGRIPESPALSTLVHRRGVTLAENLRALPYAQLYGGLAWLSGPSAETLPRVARLARSGVASYTLDARAGDAPPEGAPDFAWGRDARRLAPAARGLPDPADRRRHVSAPCAVERPRDVEIRLHCLLDSDGYLVVAESWSPRWEVRVDGDERPLLRLNHAFQGVAVTAGEREVRFGYRASPLTRASLVVSAASWLSLLVFAGVALVRRR